MSQISIFAKPACAADHPPSYPYDNPAPVHADKAPRIRRGDSNFGNGERYASVLKISRDQVLDDLGWFDAGEFLFEALEGVVEFLGVEAHEVEQGRVEVAEVDRILNR